MLNWILGLIAVYALVCAAVYVFQAALIFPGTGNAASADKAHAHNEISLTREGIKLQGWHLSASDLAGSHSANKKTVMIYFGGNAENLASSLSLLQSFGASDVYTFNYRGYGQSEGSPTQHALYADALAIYDFVAARHTAESTRFVIVGRSLGSAVAGQLANQRPTHGLVLLTPLKSAAHSGQRAFPFLPVRWLIRHPLDLYAETKAFSFPVLMLIAEGDQVIPPADSQATFDAITSIKQLVRVEGVGHNNLFSNPKALIAVQNFMARYD